MGNITKNFTLEEFEYSITATNNGISNKVPSILHNNMLNTLQVLQSARDMLGIPIIISSGYRCSRLNELVHGAKNSYHIKARAVDVVCDASRMDDLYAILKSLPHVEIIYHFPNYIHFAV
ncbi:peptidase [Dipodfec virus UOA04_Rod_524]|nr:peptidase [Dipodfec virus UOA04_Rod_524]